MDEKEATGEFYVVESIQGKRQEKNKLMYLVKWENYPETERTWEPVENVREVYNLVLEFERSANGKLQKMGLEIPGPSGSGTVDFYPEANSQEVLAELKEMQIKQQKDKLIGTFETDVPEKVNSVKKLSNTLACDVSWKKRAGGAQPRNTTYSNKVVRSKCPQLLLQFYESRIKYAQNPAPAN